MTEQLRVLVATEDDNARAIVGRVVERTDGVRVVASLAEDGDDMLDKTARRRPQMVFLSADFAGGRGFELAGRLSRKHPGLFVAVLSPRPGSVEEAQKALLVGARACIFSPVAEAEIRKAIDAARDTGEAVSAKRGAVIVVMSSKGGVGKSTVAVNLALVLKTSANRVALVDADLHFGDAATLMNVKPSATIHDLNDSFDAEIADRFLQKHPSGVEVLAAPTRTAQAEIISGERFREVLAALQSIYDLVVIDASVSSLNAMLASLEAADLVLLVTTLEVVTLKDISQVLAMLAELHFPSQNLMLVGNRHDGRVSLDPDQVSKTVGMRFTTLLPQDPRVILAGNRGIPAVLSEPHIPFSLKVRELARAVETELGRKEHVRE